MFLTLLPWYLLWAMHRYCKDRDQVNIINGVHNVLKVSPELRAMLAKQIKEAQ